MTLCNVSSCNLFPCLFSQRVFSLFVHRNLGKSGLRVSCLGLGELVWRQENILLIHFEPLKQNNKMFLSLLWFRYLGDIWITDSWWGESNVVSQFQWEVDSRAPSLILLLWKTFGTVNTNLSFFNYRFFFKILQTLYLETIVAWWDIVCIFTLLSSLHSVLHRRPLRNCNSQSQFLCSPRWLRTWWP